MDYRQFIQILKDEKSGSDALNILNEFVKEYPYFQTAQSLLAKEMNRQQHVRYERQLKIAAAYSPDRKALHSLIHPKKVNLFSTEPVIEHPQLPEEVIVNELADENIFIAENATEIIPPDINHQQAQQPETVSPVEEKIEVNHFIEEMYSTDTEIETEELPPSDPHEIIRRRLIEILGLPLKEESPAETIAEVPVEKEKVESSETVSSIPETIENFNPAHSPSTEEIDSNEEIIKHTPHTTPSIKAEIFEEQLAPVAINKSEETGIKDIIDQIAEESEKAVDDIDRGELEYALEASLIQSLEKLPIIEKAPKNEPVEEEAAGTFLEWLKIKSTGDFGKIEEVHAYDEPVAGQAIVNEEQKSNRTALIDRFIKEEPRIVVSKTEFYSPANQAKKSITDYEDIVSETLAKIYHQQGNILKARSMYEKLSLHFPEKKAYFAALISGIDKEINQQNKQDL